MNVDLKFVFCTMVFLVASLMRWFDKIPAPEWSSMTLWVVVGYVFGVAALKAAEGWTAQAVTKQTETLIKLSSATMAAGGNKREAT